MSNLCKTTLCSVVQNTASRVGASCDTTDLLFSAFSADKIEPTNRISKVIFGCLPDISTVPNGHIAFLDDAKVPVIASNGSWVGIDGRTIGTFIENQIWGWGSGSCGGLGDGTVTTRCSPVRERCFATDWCSVSACCHTAAVKTSGELWAWGSNSVGRLGDGTTINRCSPVREFCSATDWCSVSAGGLHTAAVKTSGEIWVWGHNSGGRLGDGTTVDKCSPVREFCSATDWCSVSAGGCHNAAVKTSGQLWVWGLNSVGRLGDGTETCRCSPVREICSATDWCSVSAGSLHTAAVKTSGELWAWGFNCARLGDGTTVNKCSPVREFCSATDWCSVSAGGDHTAAIKTSGQAWSWGSNNYGQLGAGTATTRWCFPVREICSATDWCSVSAGGNHTAAIKTSGELWAWGSNVCGRLGDGTLTNRCSPVREISSSTDWCQVSAGQVQTAAVAYVAVICG